MRFQFILGGVCVHTLNKQTKSPGDSDALWGLMPGDQTMGFAGKTLMKSGWVWGARQLLGAQRNAERVLGRGGFSVGCGSRYD